MVALPAFYAAKAVNPNSYSTGSKGVSQDLIDEAVIDDSEDIIVYSGEETDAVITSGDRVETEEGDFYKSGLYDMLEREVAEMTEEMEIENYLEETVGLETEEEGETDQHIFVGEADEYSAEVTEYTEDVQTFREVEGLLGDSEEETRAETDYSEQTAAV